MDQDRRVGGVRLGQVDGDVVTHFADLALNSGTYDLGRPVQMATALAV